jgi:tetratricopeptide (TPR) repeat protein
MKTPLRRKHVAEKLLLPLVSLLAVFPALTIGGVHPTTQMIVLGVVAIAAALLGFLRKRHDRRVAFPRLLGWAMLVGIAFTALQIVPLPRSVLRLLSPSSFEIRSVTTESAGWWPISLAPSGTAIELAKQVACFGALFVAANFLLKPRRVLVVLQTFLIVGTALAIVGLIQRALDAQTILGIYHTDWWHGFMATFVDPNHAAGFFILVLGVGIGLAAHANGRTRLVMFASLVPTIIALFVTRSRGGIAGALALILIYVGLTISSTERDRRREGLMVAGITVLLSATAGLVLFPEVEGRLKQALAHPFDNAKVTAWRDTWTMAKSFPAVGIGRGAFIDVFPRFDQHNHDVTVSHAENLPLQAIAEWGFPVTICIAALALVGGIQVIRSSRGDPIGRAGGAAVAALLVQNLFDFNLEFPATAIPACLILGILSSGKFGPDQRVSSSSRLPSSAPRLPSSAKMCAGLAAASLVVLTLTIPAIPHTLQSEDRKFGAAVRVVRQRRPIADELEVAIAGHPADYRLQLLAGVLLLRFRDGHGLTHLNNAMFLNPGSPLPHVAAARALASAGYHSQAALEYREAFERSYFMSEAALNEALSLSGSVENAERAIPRNRAEMLTFARFLEKHGQPDAARNVYLEALDLPGSAQFRLEMLRSLMHLRGDHLLTIGRTLFSESQLPSDTTLVADALRAAKYSNEADSVYLEALNRFPRDWTVVSPASDILVARGSATRAEQLLNQYVTVTTDRTTRILALEKLGDLQERFGRRTEARETRWLAQRLRGLESEPASRQ